jgi:hypothetical protein
MKTKCQFNFRTEVSRVCCRYAHIKFEPFYESGKKPKKIQINTHLIPKFKKMQKNSINAEKCIKPQKNAEKYRKCRKILIIQTCNSGL